MKSIVRAKKKTNRSLHANLWGDPKSPFLKREYGPGQHGARKKKLTDYGEQLQAKQRLKTYYGNVSEKQLRKYYAEAIRRRGDTAEHLIGILESRLDNLVYKAKFVPTIFAARQFVNHGHILVNGKRVNIPSYMVKAGDVISIKENPAKCRWSLPRWNPTCMKFLPIWKRIPNSALSTLSFRSLTTFRTRRLWNRTWLSNSTPDNPISEDMSKSPGIVQSWGFLL